MLFRSIERAVYVRELWKRLQIKEIHVLTQQFLKFKASFIDSLGKKVIIIFLTKLCSSYLKNYQAN